MLLYSTDAPAGWNALPTPIKQKFYDIGQKGDWTAQEAYDHLVPDHLKDNPDEVAAWMDGDPTLGINDKDVSRIESGDNGGDYSTDNTVMEDMSVNRSRGADNMSEAELDITTEANSVDADVIEAHYQSVTEVATEADSLLETASETFFDALLPAVAAFKVGTYVADQFDTTKDKVGYGSLGAGLGAFIMTTPLGVPIAGAYGIYATYKLATKLGTYFERKCI